MKVDMKDNGCTCFCSVFMTFVHFKEINCKKSKVLQAFSGINTLEKFAKLGLPLAGYQQLGQIHRGHVDLAKMIEEEKIINDMTILLEIDLS